MKYWLNIFFVVIPLILFSGCSEENKASNLTIEQAKTAAQQFSQNLVDYNYDAAYKMTTASYQQANSQSKLQSEFENFLKSIPGKFHSMSPVTEAWEASEGKKGFEVYVPIETDEESDALLLTVVSENNKPVIAHIEFYARAD